MKRAVFALVTLVLTLLAVSAFAQIVPVPQMMHFQGRLTKPDGTPVLDGNYQVRFSLWDSSAGGTEKWNQIQNVAVRNGTFAVLLNTNTAGLFNNNLWLETKIGADAPLTPRQQLVSVAYAMKASSVSDNSITSASIVNGSITAADIASGGFNTLAWLLGGNSATNPASHFLGTPDNQPLNFRVNNRRVMRYSYAENTAVTNDYRSMNVLGGSEINSIGVGVVGATIAGGGFDYFSLTDSPNQVTADFGTISGGFGNMVSGIRGTVAGGVENVASNSYASIGGGLSNDATGTHATIAGGIGNFATNSAATVGGGSANHADGQTATVSGGLSNTASGLRATVAGGHGNTASGDWTVVGGGYFNIASGIVATIAGGDINSASALYATVGGGLSNDANGNSTTIAGGENNTANSFGGTIGGGQNNTVIDTYATIAGGFNNAASGGSSGAATVGGGGNNNASGRYATIGGGSTNSAAGRYATVPGGIQNTALGWYSLAAGADAKANHNGAFVWADSTGNDFVSTLANQFNVRASGGIRLFTNSAATIGVSLNANDGSWNSLSDKNAKTNIVPVDTRDILERLVAIPIATWNYKGVKQPIRHIGPMAQDFFAAFRVGKDDKHIGSVDADGVALAAIQGLYRKMQAQQLQIDELKSVKAENTVLRQQLAELTQLVREVKATQEALGGRRIGRR
jgi:trimeric autotransporter adhesin